jgi:hypothetical protein
MRPLLCLLLLIACAVPTEPRVVDRVASVESPLDVTGVILTKGEPYDTPETGCELIEVPHILVVNGVKYLELVLIPVCP